MKLYEYVEDLALNSGDTYRGKCPVCNSHNTFTASNLNGLLVWNCYKNSCRVKGRTLTRLSVDDINSRINGSSIASSYFFVKPPYIISMLDVDDITVNKWCDRWDLDVHDLMYDIKDRRVVFPIYNKGTLVDAAGRAISHKQVPKWMRYGKSEHPFTYGEGSIAVLVEDCISASVVGGNGKVGVAILGTSLSSEHVRLLSTFDKVIVALDPDALSKTLAYTKELRSVVPTVYALKLHDDLKYRVPDDLERLEDLAWNK